MIPLGRGNRHDLLRKLEVGETRGWKGRRSEEPEMLKRGKDREGEKGKWYREEGAFKGLNYSSYL